MFTNVKKGENMKTETMYVIVDPDGKRMSVPQESENVAWALAFLGLSGVQKSHFIRAGYQCVEVTVSPKEQV